MSNAIIVDSVATVAGEITTSQSPRRASYNPATGELLGYVPLAGIEGISAAVGAAGAAQPAWAALTLKQRAAILKQFGDKLVDEADKVAELISLEQGKAIVEAYSIEIMATLAHLRWLTARDGGLMVLAEQKVGTTHPLFGAKKAILVAEALGVVAVIAPWNYPFALPLGQILTALLAGNAVVLKPSPYTPLVAQKIADLFRQTALPAGVLNVIHILDEEAEKLTSSPDIHKIIFTGSTATGRKVMASAAQVPTPVVLELGGKDAAIVAPDADLKRTVAAITWYAMANTGQTCVSIERVLAHTEIYDAFVAQTAEAVKKLTVGEGTDGQTQVGSLTTEAQLRTVEAQVEDAQAKGARVLVGGYRQRGVGYFYAPTVLADVTPDMQIMQDETFGPVIPIMRVPSLEAAVEEANRLPYGLVASVWTRDEKIGLTLAKQIKGGAVNVNDHAFHFIEGTAPWGGVGASGFGRTHGPSGLMEMVNLKYIATDMRRGALEAWWYPYNDQARHLLKNATRFLYGRDERRWWAMVSLLMNPRTWTRVNVGRLVAGIRKWL